MKNRSSFDDLFFIGRLLLSNNEPLTNINQLISWEVNSIRCVEYYCAAGITNIEQGVIGG